ncbi:hypothetical protein GM3708_3391 [Geminocystis sp. NIES-3708]|uniref:vWA domain-containing protein n=1 Tax=Geminocystis sp. NIES-3708 TaxID=1615909 RepID=UPI0005FC682C|nr:VWA domain-containing protein [Geminocystis sp. NIES-3708]BAQ62985.1 hypothetical protein GM3708_3391 [Geminocystis sp. NIES-3708]
MTIQPQITFIPIKNAVASDAITELDLIVRITVPEIKSRKQRLPLNLGLVIDRSGSMEGKKIEYARKAACFAVNQLLSTDRISVTIYDDQIEVIVPSTLANNKEYILNKIKSITARSMTALYDGWLEGATQVSKFNEVERLNRVILLSDGLANVGETNPDAIATNVNGLSKHGVSTTTMGIGDDFNEDLMQGIALSGDGNYYYIQDAEQLPNIFENELQGIIATVGQKVSIGIKTLAEVRLVDVFNDLDKTQYGNYKLPNLITGNSFDLVLRLKIPAMIQPMTLADFRLAYDDMETKSRKISHAQLQLLVVTSAELATYPENEEVNAKVLRLNISRAKEEVVRNLDEGDITGATKRLEQVKQEIMSAPACHSMSEEMEQVDDLLQDLEGGNQKSMRKKAQYQNYNQRRNRLLSISDNIYWHNIGFNEQDWWQYVKTNNVLSCINPEDRNATYFKGDKIIAYANEYGALGWGIVTKDTTYRKIEEGSVEDVKNGTHLYRLDLEWQCVVDNIEDGIKGTDILSKFNIHYPLSAFSRITNNENAELLIQELENKFNSI